MSTVVDSDTEQDRSTSARLSDQLVWLRWTNPGQGKNPVRFKGFPNDSPLLPSNLAAGRFLVLVLDPTLGLVPALVLVVVSGLGAPGGRAQALWSVSEAEALSGVPQVE